MQNSVLILMCMNVSAPELCSPYSEKCWRKWLLPIVHIGFGFCHLEKEVDTFGQTWATEH